MVEEKFLRNCQFSRLATILFRIGTVACVLGLLFYSFPLIYSAGQFILIFFSVFLLIFLALIIMVSLGLLLLNPDFTKFCRQLIDFINHAEDTSFLDNLIELQKYAPPLFISCYILFVIALLLFIFSKNLQQSQRGIKFTIGIMIISSVILLILLLIMKVVMPK